MKCTVVVVRNSSNNMQCAQCLKEFTVKGSLVRHMRQSCPNRFGNKRVSGEPIISTPNKRLKPSNNQASTSGFNNQVSPSSFPLDVGIERLNSAFKCRICTYRFSAQELTVDHQAFFNNVKPKVFSILNEYLRYFRIIKINWELYSLYVKPETETSDTKSFNTRNLVVTQADDLDEAFNDLKCQVIRKSGNFQEKDSGMLSILFILFPK